LRGCATGGGTMAIDAKIASLTEGLSGPAGLTTALVREALKDAERGDLLALLWIRADPDRWLRLLGEALDLDTDLLTKRWWKMAIDNEELKRCLGELSADDLRSLMRQCADALAEADDAGGPTVNRLESKPVLTVNERTEPYRQAHRFFDTLGRHDG